MAVTQGYHHIAMRVNNFDRSVSFYTEVLGFEVFKEWKSGEGRAAMLDTGNAAYLEVFERVDGRESAAEAEGPVLHFAFRVSHCDDVLERVRESGAEVTVETKNVDIPSDPVYPVRIAFFKGPDGEIVELFQER